MRLDGIWTEAQGRLISSCNLEPCIPSSINSSISCRLPGMMSSSPSLLKSLSNYKDQDITNLIKPNSSKYKFKRLTETMESLTFARFSHRVREISNEACRIRA